jgi:2-dehydro-3-deoxyphosphogluconate aldolase/(4S)-4-hydroxy-2-oxoglutarate aldolase
MSRTKIVERIIDDKAVAVIRLRKSQNFLKVAEALYEGGISILEITMTTPNALALIKETVAQMPDDVLIGAGSVLDADTAQRVINAGARYVVSPVFKPQIIQIARQNDVPAMPGCFSPTEILNAHEQGADVVKVFPADILGMAFFKSIKAPMPFLNLMPTGGVTLTNAGDWIKAGACAVGVGSALVDNKSISTENYPQLTENAKILRKSLLHVQESGGLS